MEIDVDAYNLPFNLRDGLLCLGFLVGLGIAALLAALILAVRKQSPELLTPPY